MISNIKIFSLPSGQEQEAGGEALHPRPRLKGNGMFAQLKPEELLFIDIETVPGRPAFAELEEPMRELWAHKAQQLTKGERSPEEYYERAVIYAEFGKIV